MQIRSRSRELGRVEHYNWSLKWFFLLVTLELDYFLDLFLIVLNIVLYVESRRLGRVEHYNFIKQRSKKEVN